MNVAFFHNLSPGGAKRVLYEQVRFLSGRKHSLDLYTYKDADESYMDVNKIIKNIYKYKIIFNNDTKGINRFQYDLRILFHLNNFAKIIAKDIDGRNYDMVIVHPDNLTQAPYILRHLNTPTIYFCEELLRNTYEDILGVDKTLPKHKYFYEKTIRYMRKIVDRENAQSADTIMTASNYIKNKVKFAYGRNAIVNRLGVDTHIFNNANNKNSNYLLFIGQKEKVTGYEFAKNVSDILGTGYEIKVIDSRSNKLALTDKQMANIYSEAFLTLCTSYNEPFGLTAIESMACGTPVLAVNEGGYKESVIDGVTGYLLPRNAKAFAKKIIELKNNPSLYKKLSVNCVKTVKEKWSWEEHGKRLEKVIKNSVSRHSERSEGSH